MTPKREGSLGGFVTAQERQQLPDLLEKAIRGDEQAISDVCEFIAMRMKQEILNRLLRAGVGSALEEAWQEVLLTLQQKLSQLKVVDAFESWLRRVLKSVAKQFRPRCARYSKSIQDELQIPEQPRQIGERSIGVVENPQIVRIFESAGPQEQLTPKRLLFKPLSEEIIAKASMANRLNYPRKIDVWSATAQLPKRWAKAFLLIYVEGRTAAEVAAIMGCRVERVYKLVQKAKQRMRELLPGYREGQPNAVRSVQTKQKNPKNNKHQRHRPRPVTLCGKFDVTHPSSAEAFPP